jgi:hypothetical protein
LTCSGTNPTLEKNILERLKSGENPALARNGESPIALQDPLPE